MLAVAALCLAVPVRADDGQHKHDVETKQHDEHGHHDEQGHHDEHRQRLATGAKVLAARQAYLTYCAACHGDQGSGRTAQVDFGSPEAVASISRKRMVDAALHGHDRSVSAAWESELSEAQIVAIVGYIRESLMLPAPVEDASMGRAIYARTCSVCHGERGNSASWAKNSLNPAPFDFTSEKAKSLTRQRMIHSVTYGVTGSAMMPFATQYSRDEIVAVVDYIRATFIPELKEGEEPVAASGPHSAHGHGAGDELDFDAPFPRGLVGDYQAGLNFYEKNCSECHGLKGKGDGRRAYFMRAKPKNFTTEKARAELNRPHLFESISHGVELTEMAAWSTVLDDQQIANVAEFVFSTFVRPQETPPGSGQGPSWRPSGGHEHGDGQEHEPGDAKKKH